VSEPVLLPPPQRASIGRASVPASAVASPAAVIEPGHRPEGYRLRVDGEGARISASDEAGVTRARATLAQLGRADGATAEADITDWPELPVRGLMLDISRDKVPTMETLGLLVEVMAAWKLNHLQLYIEHTYAYRDHEEVWRHASPLTADEVTELQGLCAAHHIELAANQNCLGHMERWLAHDRYRSLAIAPDGVRDAFGYRPPTTLDPGRPGSLELVRSLLAELLPHFDSRLVNVGLDEPWELPAERSADYGAYLRALRDCPELDGREMLVWGDIVAQHPELVAGIPDGVTVCEWGYEADHPFPGRLAALADAGKPFWACPGTSSWDSLLGRWTNARLNCQRAAGSGREAGAGGLLITDWGDLGHLQPLPVSLPGLAAGAAAGWAPSRAPGLGPTDYVTALARDAHQLLDGGTETLAAAILALGDAYLAVEPQAPNSSAPILHLYYPRMRVGQGTTAGLDDRQLDAFEAVLDRADRDLPAPDAPGGASGSELRLVVDMARLAAADARARLAGDGSLRSIPAARRRELADRADTLAAEHEERWVRRNRPGGSHDSADRLRHLAACHRSGEASAFLPSWQAPPS
jgi:hexosaminidase